MSLDADYDPDDQDLAEAFDEDNMTEGDEMPTSDMRRDVLDVTSAVGDADDFSAEDDDAFDPDQADEEELEMLLEEDDGIDSPRTLPRDDADLVQASSDESPADYEGTDGGIDDVIDDYADDDEESGKDADQPSERALDEGVEETFPASDPVSVSPGAD